MEGPQRISFNRLIQSIPFLFFSSALAITFTIYYPTIIIYLILWLLYFYYSSSNTDEDKIDKKTDEVEKYYKILEILDDQPKSNHSTTLLSKLKDFSKNDRQDEHESNASNQSNTFQVSSEFLYNMLENILNLKQKKNDFSLDDWLESTVANALPLGTDKEFEYFVKNNREEILKRCDSSEKAHLKLILFSKPRSGINNVNKKSIECPNFYHKKIFKFMIKKDPTEANDRIIIEGDKFWFLIITGNADFFLKYDYSKWFPANTNTPFWLIPFSLYRWWTPDNNSFSEKFVMFSQHQQLPETTKENMHNDLLYLFISAYIKNELNFSTNLEIARISTMMSNKFEAYCLIGLLKAEKIIAVNPYIYEEVVTQCINYLTDQNSSWPLAAFVLIKEKYDTQLKQFLELHCEETNSIKKEKAAIEHYDNNINGRFHIEEKLLYRIKGEKIISHAKRSNNQNDFPTLFNNGISCLLKSYSLDKDKEIISNVLKLLVDYYLIWIAEVGESLKNLVEKFKDVNTNLKDENPMNEDNYPDPKNEDHVNYLILDIVSKCYQNYYNNQKDETDKNTNDNASNALSKSNTNNAQKKDDSNAFYRSAKNIFGKAFNILNNFFEFLSKSIDNNTQKDDDSNSFSEIDENDIDNTSNALNKSNENNTQKKDDSNSSYEIDENTFENALYVLNKSNKNYTIRRFVYSMLIKQKGWKDYLMTEFDVDHLRNADGIPEDEIIYYQYLID